MTTLDGEIPESQLKLKIQKFLNQKWRGWIEHIERYDLEPLDYHETLDACYRANVDAAAELGGYPPRFPDPEVSPEELLEWFKQKRVFDQAVISKLNLEGLLVYPLAQLALVTCPLQRPNGRRGTKKTVRDKAEHLNIYVVVENAGVVRIPPGSSSPPAFEGSTAELVEFIVAEGLLDVPARVSDAQVNQQVGVPEVETSVSAKVSAKSVSKQASLVQPNLPVPANLLTTVALTMIWGGGEKWLEKNIWKYLEDESTASVVHRTNNGGQISGTYEPFAAERAEPMTFEKVDVFLKGLSVRTGDVALAVLAALGRSRNPLVEPVLISTDDIYRLKGAKLYGENRKRFDLEICEEIERLQCLRFDAHGIRGQGKAPIMIKNDRLFDILDVKEYQQNLFGPNPQTPTMWSVRAGHWAHHFFNPEARKWITGMAASLFALSHRDDRLVEQLAKKIGQYVVLNFWRLGKGQPLSWSRATLLEKIGESIELKTKPPRFIEAFDEALKLLEERKIFEAVESEAYSGGRTKGWVERYLEGTVEFVPAGMGVENRELPLKGGVRKKSPGRPPKKVGANRSLDFSRVKIVRETLHLNQGFVAGELGISRRYLSDIENGKKVPSSKVSEKLDEWLAANPAEL